MLLFVSTEVHFRNTRVIETCFIRGFDSPEKLDSVDSGVCFWHLHETIDIVFCIFPV